MLSRILLAQGADGLDNHHLGERDRYEWQSDSPGDLLTKCQRVPPEVRHAGSTLKETRRNTSSCWAQVLSQPKAGETWQSHQTKCVSVSKPCLACFSPAFPAFTCHSVRSLPAVSLAFFLLSLLYPPLSFPGSSLPRLSHHPSCRLLSQFTS